MSTIAKHTNYLLLNEKGDIELVSYSPEQNYSGRRDSDQYRLSQGLFILEISDTLWLTDVLCYRVVDTPMGLQRIENLTCKIVAKQTCLWDINKPIGQRKSDEKKSSKWDEFFHLYVNKK
jgi:hypothetical protein